ncbi:hypothetical protein [Flavobacterium sp. ZB4P13]|uniref:hypothetical protein n=1 Tax=Flavobacterium sp. ZB4P13 TaxID=3401728 RepID=UPI003AAF88BA
MRILFLTDSLGLPRDSPELVRFEECWIQIVKSNFPKFHFDQVSLGGATIDVLFNQYDYHKQFEADLIILQCGIVDCAPRAFKKFENALLNSNSLFRFISNKILNKKVINYLRKNRGIQKTSLTDFERYLSSFRDLNCKIITIEILPASIDYELQLPGIMRNIEIYNQKLKKYFNTVELSNFEKGLVMSDFHHLNVVGNRELARVINAKIFDFEK